MDNCRQDQILNPETGRCVKKTGAIGRKLLGLNQPKPCKNEEIRNPTTGRCVKRRGKIGRKLIPQERIPKERDPRFIFNPETRRYVLRDGDVGKRILEQQALLQEEGKYMELPEIEEIDTRNILQTRRRRGAIPEYVDRTRLIQMFGPKILDIIPLGYRVSKRIGDASLNGSIWLLCDYTREYTLNCNLVMKVQVLDYVKEEKRILKETRKRTSLESIRAGFIQRMQREAEIQKLFAKAGLAPRMLMRSTYEYNRKDYFVIVMDRVDTTLSQFLENYPKGASVSRVCANVAKGVDELVRATAKLGLIHGDMHTGNIGLQFEYAPDDNDEEFEPDDDTGVVHGGLRFLLIDFGWASKGSFPYLDLIQALRTMIYPTKYKNTKLKECLVESMFKIFKKAFGNDKTPLEYNAINTAFLKAHQDYVKRHYSRVAL